MMLTRGGPAGRRSHSGREISAIFGTPNAASARRQIQAKARMAASNPVEITHSAEDSGCAGVILIGLLEQNACRKTVWQKKPPSRSLAE